MTATDQAPSARTPALLLPIYGAAIFLSAALLFAVQPMFTKMVLPRFGGSPSVWSVAMVFFQALLLCGYAYAHLLTRVLPSRIAVIVQVAVMSAALFALPLAIASGWGRPPESGAAFWLIGLFAVSIGLPFFALSANGPLLQAWFARTDHPAAKNPYFLYAASNIGSFLALLAYPVAIEPFIRLGDQTWGWSAGFLLLIALVAGSGAMLWRTPDAGSHDIAEADASAPPTMRDAVVWMALAAVPSGLLVAVTAHISTDVAAVPLLWVVPLALYLLTFVIVFSTRPLIPHRVALIAQPIIVAALVSMLVIDFVDSIVLQVLLHIAAFFASALVCHGELARRRPAPRHLTAFYMWMSAGGMLGGLAAGLIAPFVFNWVAEYPILIALALLCRPGLAIPRGRERLIWIAALVAAALVLGAAPTWSEQISATVQNVTVALLLLAAIALWRRPLAMAAIVAFIFTADRLYTEDATVTVRSFFGVHKISEDDKHKYRVLLHGTTIHGAERIPDPGEKSRPGEKPDLAMYYYDGSAIAQAIDAARERAGGRLRFAVVGLGAGSLACRANAGDTLSYYEIDPAVVTIARDPKLFTFLSACGANVPMVMGDARLTLADAPDASYDLIVIDAFSSDAIPIHLMTREAMALYRQKLSPHGMVLMHVSNRHLELASVVAGIARANGLVTRVNTGGDIAPEDEYKMVGTVTAVAKNDEDFAALAKSKFWPVEQPDPKQWVWTDDYSNVVGALIRKYWGR